MSQGNFLPGELKVDAIVLTNPEGEVVDIKNLVQQIDIFESITESFLHGRISVVDALGIADDYKIVGQESLTITYRVKEDVDKFSNPIEKTFRTYKITNVHNVNYETYGYAIHFIDPKFFVCENTRISKAMRGSYSEMLLQTLIEKAKFDKLPEKVGVDFWENSKPSTHQLVCPNWSLNELISYVKENANYGDDAVFKNSMFFYQTMIGGFRFMSLDTMLGAEPLFSEFNFKPRNENLDQEKIPNEADAGQSSRILAFEIQKKSDTLRGTTRGAYSSSLKTYDPIRKIHRDIFFDLNETFKGKRKNKHLSGYPPIRLEEYEKVVDGNSEFGSVSGQEREIDLPANQNYLRGAKTHYAVNPTNAFSDSDDIFEVSNEKNQDVNKTVFIGNENMDNAMLERESMIELLSQNVLKVTIPYRQDISAGNIIKIKLPIGKQESNQNPLNDNRYLITNVRHQIATFDFRGTMVLQCVKESLASDIKEVDALKTYEGPIDDE
jgi:hypothetical protein